MITFKQYLAEGKTIKDKTGYVEYNWKSDLEDEEDEGYIPKGYKKKVLELAMIETEEHGQGHGAALMKKFLETPDAQKAELIFLDPNPGNADDATVNRLVKFYKQFGFRHNPKAGSKRMWLVRKGSIPDDQLPT